MKKVICLFLMGISLNSIADTGATINSLQRILGVANQGTQVMDSANRTYININGNNQQNVNINGGNVSINSNNPQIEFREFRELKTFFKEVWDPVKAKMIKAQVTETVLEYWYVDRNNNGRKVVRANPQGQMIDKYGNVVHDMRMADGYQESIGYYQPQSNQNQYQQQNQVGVIDSTRNGVRNAQDVTDILFRIDSMGKSLNGIGR